ncbi:MAG: glutaredoxin family protein [Candidatus Nanopelagicales bacterium]
MTARVQLVGKPGCHLCDDVRVVLARVCAETGVAWTELSILDDPVLADKYWELIPVTLVDGAVVGSWFIDEPTLRAALT